MTVGEAGGGGFVSRGLSEVSRLARIGAKRDFTGMTLSCRRTVSYVGKLSAACSIVTLIAPLG
eukprot:1246127-Pyramimonas_sp.AAC.1